MKELENCPQKEYHLIRRYLVLNSEDKSFRVLKDKSYTIRGEGIDDAFEKLTEKLNYEEGKSGLILNDGYPEHVVTGGDRNSYALRYYFAMLCFQEELEENKKDIRFIDILKEFEGFNEEHLYRGFYASKDFSAPRVLLINRMRCLNNVFDYLFYPEKGKYKGEFEKYLYFENQIYSGNREDISNLHFETE
ncbi:hypothetical protein D2A34_19860 [Clostridium chromiireducens]|uniref:Uncharacterized protein n=1 Tax=Clostridium chromiireducens TaxID=225345 RepID=A0A399IJB1_9CLOT|nr:hypothetical protein [Clostridium chromiireducens]RII33085.1 hypothetical protein D2A34_19860 [Clostridium chromiireducens]